MYHTDVLRKTRLFINDSSASPRWTDTELIEWCGDAIKEVRKLRPDSQIDEDGELIEFEPMPLTGFYQYEETGGHADYTSEYEDITGWNRETYPTLYLSYASATTTISIFASSADRTATTPVVGTVNTGGTTGTKTVTAGTWTALGGTISVDSAITDAHTWEIVSSKENLIVSDDFESALAHFIAFRAFSQDSDDEANQRLAKQHLELFTAEIS